MMPKIDEYGRFGVNSEEALQIMKKVGKVPENLYLCDVDIKYKKSCEILGEEPIPLWEDSPTIDVSQWHLSNQNVFKMPNEYMLLDIKVYLLSLCNTAKERDRVLEELEVYEKFNMLNILKYMKYLRDIAIRNNLIWGVGRGSSCSSYILYLMGVHKIDSLQYNLDIHEFLRET